MFFPQGSVSGGTALDVHGYFFDNGLVNATYTSEVSGVVRVVHCQYFSTERVQCPTPDFQIDVGRHALQISLETLFDQRIHFSTSKVYFHAWPGVLYADEGIGITNTPLFPSGVPAVAVVHANVGNYSRWFRPGDDNVTVFTATADQSAEPVAVSFVDQLMLASNVSRVTLAANSIVTAIINTSRLIAGRQMDSLCR
jgi:hypothetical protein